MGFEFIQITHIRVHHFKSFSRVKLPQNERVNFIIGNVLILTRVE